MKENRGASVQKLPKSAVALSAGRLPVRSVPGIAGQIHPAVRRKNDALSLEQPPLLILASKREGAGGFAATVDHPEAGDPAGSGLTCRAYPTTRDQRGLPASRATCP